MRNSKFEIATSS